MNNVVEHIEYLVRHHDCVVLPSWGAFIARYQSASYDEAQSVFIPPSREISFNASVAHNDGLLISSVSRRRKVPFAAASRIVEEEIAAMKHQLEVDGELPLGNVGRFIRQEGSTMIFEPSDRLTRYETYGLQPVAATPVIELARREVASSKADDSSAVPVRPRFGLRAIRIAASVAVVVGVGLLLTGPSIFNRNDNFASMSSTELFSSRSSQVNILPAQQKGNATLNIALPPTESVVSESVEMTPSEPVAIPKDDSKAAIAAAEGSSTVRFNADDSFCLVVASLASDEQARRFIREDGNEKLAVFEKDGKYRVYVATGNSSEETNRQRSKGGIASRYPDAWVCRMR